MFVYHDSAITVTLFTRFVRIVEALIKAQSMHMGGWKMASPNPLGG